MFYQKFHPLEREKYQNLRCSQEHQLRSAGDMVYFKSSIDRAAREGSKLYSNKNIFFRTSFVVRSDRTTNT